MKIYRVQDKNGRGPWKPGFSEKWVEYRDDHENLLPYYNVWPDFNPHNELPEKHNFGCGCKTIDDLRRWFTASEYKKLRAFGYKAVSMDVDIILRDGDTQCVFARKRSLRKGVVGVALYAA